MSYEKSMMTKLKMPPKTEVAQVILKTLFHHNGIIKEFRRSEELVEQIANEFHLTDEQRSTYLEIFYKKENRIKRSSLWHRLLFRSASLLAKEKLISRPTETKKISGQRAWMLTEKGYDYVLNLLQISPTEKTNLPVTSYEVQKEQQDILNIVKPTEYNPIDFSQKKKVTTYRKVRNRAFRFAVIKSYGYQCAICRLKLYSPNQKSWEVEAAHIVPHSCQGKDDIWNGMALCRLHHWAFDVGWFTINLDYCVKLSSKVKQLPKEVGKMGAVSLFNTIMAENAQIYLPTNPNNYPHKNAVMWHNKHIFQP